MLDCPESEHEPCRNAELGIQSTERSSAGLASFGHLEPVEIHADEAEARESTHDN